MPLIGKLPDKPSALILLALEDLEKAEKNPTVTVNMNDWLIFRSNGNCIACLAGCVMLGTLQITKEMGYEYIYPDRTNLIAPSDAEKLTALDQFRMGYIRAGLEHMGIPMPLNLRHYYDVGAYYIHLDTFKANLREMVAYLQTFGL